MDIDIALCFWNLGILMMKQNFCFETSMIRELSFLKLDTGVEEFLDGYQIFGLVLLGYQIFRKKLRNA